MKNPIKEIYEFNHKAGLVDRGYDDFLESSFQVEEALEGFNIPELAKNLGLSKEASQDIDPKTLSRTIMLIATRSDEPDVRLQLSDVDRLDKACDAVVFAVGSMTKLGLNPQQITKALNVVMTANNAKLGCPKDEHGKLMKPDGWEEKYAPEPKLQAILDERSV